MHVPDRASRVAHPVLRRLLLLIPLTWPGVAYGLWQRRRVLWLSLPWRVLGIWWRGLGFCLAVTSVLALIGVAVYGVVIYGAPLLAGLWQSVPPTAGGVLGDSGDVAQLDGGIDSLHHTMARLMLPIGSAVMMGCGLLSMLRSPGMGGALIGLGVGAAYLATILGNLPH